jgi:hypothetical protein
MLEMKRGRTWPALAVAGLALALTPGASAGTRDPAPASQAASCASGWVLQQRAGPGTLGSVAAISPRAAWAVGSRPDAEGFPVTLAERWNGTGWAVVPTPDPPAPLPPSPADVLDAVTAVSASDAWAVGGAGEMSGQMAAGLAEHWNGSRWTAVSVPRLNQGGQLEGVAAVSADEVWAVGAGGVTSANGPQVAYALRWDGRRWSSVAVPQPGEFRGLTAVTRIPGTDALWAVGFQRARPGAPYRPMIDYWNGARWSVAAAPAVGSLNDVTALGPDDAWAVGGDTILRWNGIRWSQVPVNSGVQLAGVTALTPGDAWAVGDGTILRWNGTTWQSASWPHPAGAVLSAVTVVQGASGWTAWTVGHTGSTKSLIAARCGGPG